MVWMGWIIYFEWPFQIGDWNHCNSFSFVESCTCCLFIFKRYWIEMVSLHLLSGYGISLEVTDHERFTNIYACMIILTILEKHRHEETFLHRVFHQTFFLAHLMKEACCSSYGKKFVLVYVSSRSVPYRSKFQTIYAPRIPFCNPSSSHKIGPGK